MEMMEEKRKEEMNKMRNKMKNRRMDRSNEERKLAGRYEFQRTSLVVGNLTVS